MFHAFHVHMNHMTDMKIYHYYPYQSYHEITWSVWLSYNSLSALQTHTTPVPWEIYPHDASNISNIWPGPTCPTATFGGTLLSSQHFGDNDSSENSQKEIRECGLSNPLYILKISLHLYHLIQLCLCIICILFFFLCGLCNNCDSKAAHYTPFPLFSFWSPASLELLAFDLCDRNESPRT